MNEITLNNSEYVANKEITVVNNEEKGTKDLTELSVKELKHQVFLIQSIMRDVMRKDEHYGVIPGCGNKPTLLKSGAEKLLLTFRLSPSYSIKQKDLENGHREYEVVTKLKHINSDLVFGEGVGFCSTNESKYRYKWENTGKIVPDKYWENKDINLLGGSLFSARKAGKGWYIHERKQNDNPSDHYNTVLKMAKKRSLVDAVLTCTAASDIFTQDIEDFKEEEIVKTDKGNGHQQNTSPKKKAVATTLPDHLQEKYDEFVIAMKDADNDMIRLDLKAKEAEWTIGQAKLPEFNDDEVAEFRLYHKLIQSVDISPAAEDIE